MSSPLLEIWEATSASPYQPTVSKSSQFAVGFILLLLGKSKLFQPLEARLTIRAALILTGIFGLSMLMLSQYIDSVFTHIRQIGHSSISLCSVSQLR